MGQSRLVESRVASEYQKHIERLKRQKGQEILQGKFDFRWILNFGVYVSEPTIFLDLDIQIGSGPDLILKTVYDQSLA